MVSPCSVTDTAVPELVDTRWASITDVLDYVVKRRGAFLAWRDALGEEGLAELPDKVRRMLEEVAEDVLMNVMTQLSQAVTPLAGVLKELQTTDCIIHLYNAKMDFAMGTLQDAAEDGGAIASVCSDMHKYLTKYRNEHPAKELFAAARLFDPSQLSGLQPDDISFDRVERALPFVASRSTTIRESLTRQFKEYIRSTKAAENRDWKIFKVEAFWRTEMANHFTRVLPGRLPDARLEDYALAILRIPVTGGRLFELACWVTSF